MRDLLYYNRHRYYDPKIGAYINQDPIRFAGGNNFYRYPTNPLRGIDPLGLDPATGTGTFGIGLEVNNPAAYRDGVHYVMTDPGHTFAYVKDAEGNTVCTYSVGPSKPIGIGNVKAFKKDGIPGRTDWGITEESKVWEWPLKEGQYQACKDLCQNEKKKNITYSPTSQCTSEALRLAKACGISTPDGVGTVSAMGEKIAVPNPYKLDEQMSNLPSPKPQTVPVGTFDSSGGTGTIGATEGKSKK
jgi:hypothetical protein